MNFAIVLFDGVLSLVPTTWLISNKMYCYFPLIEKESILGKMISNEVLPQINDPSWTTYPVRPIMREAGIIYFNDYT